MSSNQEFVFTWEPQGPGYGRLACLVLAPDEVTATAIMLRAANGVPFELRTWGEVLSNDGLLENLRKKNPLGIGLLVDQGLKLPALPPRAWPPKLKPLDQMSTTVTVRLETLPHPHGGGRLMLCAKVVRGDIPQPLISAFPGLPELGTACEEAGIPLLGLSGEPDRYAEHEVTLDQLSQLGFRL